VFNIERSDARNDAVLYYRVTNGNPPRLGKQLMQNGMSAATASMNGRQKQLFLTNILHYASRLTILTLPARLKLAGVTASLMAPAWPAKLAYQCCRPCPEYGLTNGQNYPTL
jgi:hypothetical protein